MGCQYGIICEKKGPSKVHSSYSKVALLFTCFHVLMFSCFHVFMSYMCRNKVIYHCNGLCLDPHRLFGGRDIDGFNHHVTARIDVSAYVV